jgi:hypothetical protein
MAPEQIYRSLERMPFLPVRIFLRDGRWFDITHRRLAVVGITFVDLGNQGLRNIAYPNCRP